MRALVRMLLETHTRADVFHMMQRTVSGTWVSLGVVKTIRREMLAEGAQRRKTNIARPHLREEPAAPEPIAAVVEPAPVVRRPTRPPESFESQMARIAAGARLIAAPDLRTTGPAYTLGGVASGML